MLWAAFWFPIFVSCERGVVISRMPWLKWVDDSAMKGKGKNSSGNDKGKGKEKAAAK